MHILQRFWLSPLLLGAFAFAVPLTARAQIFVPPNNGFNATIVLPSTIDAFYTGLNKGLEQAGDGIDSLTHDTHKVHKGVGSLDSLQPGTPVAVQYVVKGIQASADQTAQVSSHPVNINEGTVTRVDRDRKRITITFANGTREALQSDNSFTTSSSRVMVSYVDKSGRRVARFFKPAH